MFIHPYIGYQNYLLLSNRDKHQVIAVEEKPSDNEVTESTIYAKNNNYYYNGKKKV